MCDSFGNDIMKKVVSRLNIIRRYSVVIILLAAIFLLFIVPHLTPEISVRTHLLFTGHPIAAITSEIRMTDIIDDQSGREYSVLQGINDMSAGNDMSSLKVRKNFFLYFAKYGTA